MKKLFLRAAAAAIAALTLIGLVSCGKKTESGIKTSKDNPFYEYAEVRELNEALVLPFGFGETAEALEKGGFELMKNGIEGHSATYRSKDNKDIAYMLGKRDMAYGRHDKNAALYVMSVRISHEGKTIKKNADGTSTPVYTTRRSVFGIKVGDLLGDARKTLIDKGYEVVYEEPKEEKGMPKTRENAYKKGIVYIVFGAESRDDISQIYIYIPYDDTDIQKLNALCELPAKLGSSYEITVNPEFKYVDKTAVERHYASADGSEAYMRGFPDYKDILLTAQVRVTADKYSVLGAKTGMSEAEARELFEKAGCVYDADGGYYKFNSVCAVSMECEGGTVKALTAMLLPSSNMANVKLGD